MYYAVVIYPDIDTSKIDSFKKKYDPYYPGIGAHITLLFPIPADEISEKKSRKLPTRCLW